MKCQKKVVPLIQPIKIGHISETRFKGRINPLLQEIEKFVYFVEISQRKNFVYFGTNYFLLKLPKNLVFSKMLLTFVDSMFWML